MIRRVLLAAGLGVLAASAGAAVLPPDAQWATFDVAYDLSGTLGWIDIETGDALSFSFTVPADFVGTLTVVDGGFAGDRFTVTNGAGVLGDTSAAVNSYPASVVLDFDAALADPDYSRAVFALGAGTYSISGSLLQSALGPDGIELDTTVGGIRLALSPVPEMPAAALLAAGLAVLATLRRRSR